MSDVKFLMYVDKQKMCTSDWILQDLNILNSLVTNFVKE